MSRDVKELMEGNYHFDLKSKNDFVVHMVLDHRMSQPSAESKLPEQLKALHILHHDTSDTLWHPRSRRTGL